VTEKTPLDEKKERLLSALDQGLTQLHLDARRPGVLVPEKFKGEHHLVLNVSYRFDPPDLSVNDWGVRQTLSFGGSRFQVGVPWSAIYAVASLVTREFWMYPDEMPIELADSVAEGVTEADLRPAGQEVPAERPRAVLREVVREPSAEAAEAPKESTEATPPRRGHLRVVK
jgi:stringent starvation protein B